MKQLHELDPREATALVKENNSITEYFYVAWQHTLPESDLIDNWDVLMISISLDDAKRFLYDTVKSDLKEVQDFNSEEELNTYISERFISQDHVQWKDGRNSYTIYSL